MVKDKIDVNLDTGALFFELMFLMFLGLKISGLIDWAWIWVFSPIWIPIVGVALIFGVMFLALVIAGGVSNGKDNKKKSS